MLQQNRSTKNRNSGRNSGIRHSGIRKGCNNHNNHNKIVTGKEIETLARNMFILPPLRPTRS